MSSQRRGTKIVVTTAINNPATNSHPAMLRSIVAARIYGRLNQITKVVSWSSSALLPASPSNKAGFADRARSSMAPYFGADSIRAEAQTHVDQINQALALLCRFRDWDWARRWLDELNTVSRISGSKTIRAPLAGTGRDLLRPACFFLNRQMAKIVDRRMGKWLIVETGPWDQVHLDSIGPAFIAANPS